MGVTVTSQKVPMFAVAMGSVTRMNRVTSVVSAFRVEKGANHLMHVGGCWKIRLCGATNGVGESG
jgi:hypothetical protein